MEAIRQPAVAGTFYPAEPEALRQAVQGYLGAPDDNCPKALIAPHAGYIYSGPVAGRAYGLLAQGKGHIRRVVLLGPSHHVGFAGMAVPTVNAFATPLGDIPIDAAAIAQIIDLPEVRFLDEAHQHEHSLEVHLPFLQETLGEFSLVPIVVGDASAQEVARVLDALWGGDDTLVVISSDLSHYQPYDAANRTDQATADKIVNLETDITGEQACGCRPINGLLRFAASRGLTVERIDVRNSGDTAGDKNAVVGYGAFKVSDGAAPEFTLNLAQRQQLLLYARQAIYDRLQGVEQFDVEVALIDPLLRETAASFVTIKIAGELRGCIGRLEASQPLFLDVARNAQAAAFDDPRFEPLTVGEYPNIDIHVSVLSTPVPMRVSSRDELLAQLRPGIDGLIISEHGQQATFLPAVWEQIPDPEQFVSELRRKAGLDPSGWSDATEVKRYTTLEFS